MKENNNLHNFKIGTVITKYTGDEKVVVIPEGITNIGERAFLENENIEKVIFPRTLRSIGRYAFDGCISLKEVKLNYGLKHICDYAFSECEHLKEIYIMECYNI